VCRPAREVGGDFYAELPGAGPGERALVYGDVSGKSISGALMMMAAHEVLNALALAHPDPEELMELANARLYSLRGRSGAMQGGSFVALGYLGFVPGNGHLRYTLAGQPPPLVWRCSTGEVEELRMPDHRVPLGALRRGGYRILSTAMDAGDLLLAYSDGVVDAQSQEGEFFGDVRLAQILSACPREPEEAVEAVLEALDDFTRGHTPYDDVTLLMARRR